MTKKIRVIITTKNNDNNRQLLQFFEANIRNLNASGLFFTFIAAYPEEKEMYAEQNITKFPALIPDGESNAYNYKVGKDNIISYVRSLYNSLNNAPAAMSFDNGGEFDANSYFIHQMMNERDEDDTDDTSKFASTVQSQLAAATQQRAASGQHSKTMSNPEIHERNAHIASRSENFNFGPSPRQNNLEPSPLDIIKKSKATSKGDAQLDDDMLEKFYSNMEPTIM
jgi:hypothetical protein